MARDQARWVIPLAALILACGGVLSAAPPPSAAPAAPASPLGLSWRGEPVHLKADRLRVDLSARQATLEGQVTLRRSDTTLRCPKIDLRFDAQGQITWAQGTGGVSVEGRDLRAEAAQVSFDLDRQALVLRGDVRLQKSGVRLTAAEATVDLQRQQIELTQVEGAIAAASASGAPAASGAPSPAASGSR